MITRPYTAIVLRTADTYTLAVGAWIFLTHLITKLTDSDFTFDGRSIQADA